MKKIVISAISTVVGAGVGFALSYLIKDKDSGKIKTLRKEGEEKIDINTVISDISDITDELDRKEFLSNFIECLKATYTSESEEDVVLSIDNMQLLVYDIDEYLFFNSLGRYAEEVEEEKKGGDSYDGATCEESTPMFSEGDNFRKQEEDSENVIPQKEQSTVQSQETVQIVEIGIPEDDVDEEQFSGLVQSLVSPLIDKYGDTVEDDLVRLVDRLSTTTIDPQIYDTYTTKLVSVLKFQEGDVGLKKLEGIISSFFNLYPPEDIED